MHPESAPTFLLLYSSLALVSDSLYEAVRETYWKDTQHVWRQRSKPTCVWAVNCEAKDPEARAPLQGTMPSVCDGQRAAIDLCLGVRLFAYW